MREMKRYGMKSKEFSIEPRQTGKYKEWVNVHVGRWDEEPGCTNWDHIDDWKELPHPEKAVLLTTDQEMSQDVLDAERAE